MASNTSKFRLISLLQMVRQSELLEYSRKDWKDGKREHANQNIMVPLKVPDNISLNDRCYASSIAFEEEDNYKIDLMLPNTASQVRLKQGYQMYAHDYSAVARVI